MLGVVMFIMLVGKFPFEEPTVQETQQAILNREIVISGIAQLKEIEKDMLARLLSKDIKSRIRIGDILKHDFLSLNEIRETRIGQFAVEEVQLIYKGLSNNFEIYNGLNIEFILLYLILYYKERVDWLIGVYKTLTGPSKDLSQ